MSHLPALVEPFGLTMDDTYLYLTNNGDPTQSVYQVDKLTGTKVVTVMQASYSSYYDIHVYKNITSPASKIFRTFSFDLFFYILIVRFYIIIISLFVSFAILFLNK